MVLAAGPWTPAAAGRGRAARRRLPHQGHPVRGAPRCPAGARPSSWTGSPACSAGPRGRRAAARAARPSGGTSTRTAHRSTPALPAAAADLVRARFPALRLGAAAPPVAAADCYAGPPVSTSAGWRTPAPCSPSPAVRAGRPRRRWPPAPAPRSCFAPPAHRAEAAPTVTNTKVDDRRTHPNYHTIGIGAGPANLSLAALFEDATRSGSRCSTGSPGRAGTTGCCTPGVRMQTSWLKDLVSLVAPRHELTFLNYLVTTGRHVRADELAVRRHPAAGVRRATWPGRRASSQNVHYGVDRGPGVLRRTAASPSTPAAAPVGRSDHLVIGLGSAPVIPDGLSGLPPERAFIADDLADRLDEMSVDRSAPIAVVGGGQTGLEATSSCSHRGFTDREVVRPAAVVRHASTTRRAPTTSTARRTWSRCSGCRPHAAGAA